MGRIIRITWLICLLMTIAVVTCSPSFASTDVAPDDHSIQWQSYEQIEKQKLASHDKYLILYIKSKSCRWCEKMDATTWQDSNVIEAVNNKFIPFRVYIDEHQALVKEYKLTSVPVIIIFDANNKILKQMAGYQSAQNLIAEIQDLDKQPEAKLPKDDNQSRADSASGQEDFLIDKQIRIYTNRH